MKFQGDIVFVQIPALPVGLREKPAENGRHVVAHSETGHHHFIDALGVKHYEASDPNVCYLSLESSSSVIHDRAWDTHAPVNLAAGCYIGIRQVERAPEGWRRVAD